MSKNSIEYLSNTLRNASTNSSQRNTALNVIDEAFNLVSAGVIQLHRDEAQPEVWFNNQTQSNFTNTGNSFLTFCGNILENSTSFTSKFRTTLVGAIFVGAVTGGYVNATIDQAADTDFVRRTLSRLGFTQDNLTLIEYGFFPWNGAVDTTIGSDAVAASYYQRRIRTGDTTMAGYKKLGLCIFQNMMYHNATFVPAQADYRQLHRDFEVIG